MNETINASRKWRKILLDLAVSSGSFGLPSAERFKAFLHAKFCLLLVPGAISFLIFYAPQVVHPSEKISSNPYSARTLLAEHPPPLLEPTSDLATPLSGPRKPESVELFRRLLRQGKRMDRFQGKEFVAEGEAYHNQGVPGGYFLLFRWHIDCCTGEVKPVGILVRGSLPESPDKSTWVRIDGLLEIQMIDGIRLPYIAATQVQKIPAPPPEKQFISY